MTGGGFKNQAINELLKNIREEHTYLSEVAMMVVFTYLKDVRDRGLLLCYINSLRK